MAAPLIWLVGRQRIDQPAAVVDGHVLRDPRVAELRVDLDLDEMRGEGVPGQAFRKGRIGRRRRDQHRAVLRHALLRDLLLQIASRLDDGGAGHDRRAAAGLADRIRAAVRIAPDELHLGERHAERLGGNQVHRRFRAGAHVGDADEHRVASPRIDLRDRVAASEPRAKRHERHAGAALDRPGVRPGLRTPPRLPVEHLGAPPDALFERVIREAVRPRSAGSCSST